MIPSKYVNYSNYRSINNSCQESSIRGYSIFRINKYKIYSLSLNKICSKIGYLHISVVPLFK